MRVLWLTNVVLPDFSMEFNIKKTYSGGWMTGMFKRLVGYDGLDIELCFPILDENRVKDGNIDGISYYSLWMGKGERTKAEISNDAERIIKTSEPDIVHIWGTEFDHCHIMCEVLEKVNFQNVILDIQGIQLFIGERYCYGIAPNWLDYTPDNEVPSIEDLKRRTQQYSSAENKCFTSMKHFIGRTRWDENFVNQVHPNSHYYHCDRVLREVFYKTPRFWEVKNCKKHSVFISQAESTFKGLHFFLQAMPYVLTHYPDLMVYIGGTDAFINSKTVEKNSAYGTYLRSIIDGLCLDKNIVFTGRLDDREMIEQYLQANVFLCCSITENNSNSTCEAQYLGTPVISSYVGGMGDIIEDKKTGLLYCYDDVRMLAGLICYAFEHPDEMMTMSRNERKVAKERHDPKRIADDMVKIYKDVLS